MINVSNLNSDSNSNSSRDTASLSGCRNKGELTAVSGRQVHGDPSAGGWWYHPSSGSNRWQLKTKRERARRGLATVATQHSGSYVGLLVWRTSSRPEASGRDLPRKWCWSRRWSTWCSSSLHEPWNASRKSSGWFFFVRLDRHHELSGRKDSHPRCCQCLTALLNFIIICAEASTKRRRLFQRPIPNMMPCVGQQKAEEVRRRESLGASAACDGWKRSIHACEEKVEGNNPPNRTRLKPVFRYPSHNLDMAVNLSGKIGQPMSVGRGRRGGTSSRRGRHCPDMTCRPR